MQPLHCYQLISRGCGQLNACTSHLHIIVLLYAGAHDHASFPSTVNHVTRRTKLKLEWRRKNAQPQSKDQQWGAPYVA